ncbi:MAG: formyltransferase family protein [bacterium]|nr:formyltransferase family protein [bacterium]
MGRHQINWKGELNLSGRRFAALVSGGGSTMKRIGDACLWGKLNNLIELVLVVASKPGIGAIEKARELGLPDDRIHVCNPRDYSTPKAFGQAIIGLFRRWGIEQIGQHGWLPLTPENVIEAYDGHIINQHPGPLDTGFPDFGGPGMYGRRVHCARLLYIQQTGRSEDLFTEATAHRVTPEFDRGSIIGWTSMPIRPDDTVESIQKVLLSAEHQLQIDVLEKVALGRRLKPLVRTHRLVPDDWVPLLEECKRLACLLYPNG